MTTTSLTPSLPARAAAGPAWRSWTAAGIGAGLAGIAGIVGSSLAGAVYDPAIAGDATAIVERTADLVPQILLFHVATMVSALLLVVFAAGLRRRLETSLPAGSLLPAVASSGLMLVSVAGLIGTGLNTEFLFGASDPDLVVPETVAVFGHWMGTIPWLWAGAGVAALAVALAARAGAAPRWIGRVSLVLGGLTTLFAVSPLQYMAGMVGPLWLTIVSIWLFASDSRQS